MNYYCAVLLFGEERAKELMNVALTLSEEERQACVIMSSLKCNIFGQFYKCPENDRILETAKETLHGGDPIALFKRAFGGEVWKDDMELANIDAIV